MHWARRQGENIAAHAPASRERRPIRPQKPLSGGRPLNYLGNRLCFAQFEHFQRGSPWNTVALQGAAISERRPATNRCREKF